jgi:hypothetical protein
VIMPLTPSQQNVVDYLERGWKLKVSSRFITTPRKEVRREECVWLQRDDQATEETTVPIHTDTFNALALSKVIVFAGTDWSVSPKRYRLARHGRDR